MAEAKPSTPAVLSSSRDLSVSVVIPTYNHAEYLGHALASVYAQTLPAAEVIVVNDGSPDDTDAAIAPWLDRPGIRYIKQPNAGQAAARNRGAALATGALLAFLDDDDLWPVEKLEFQVGAFQQHSEAVLAYGYVAPFSVPAELAAKVDFEIGPSGDVRAAFRHRNWIVSPGQTLIRRKHFAAVGGFDPALWGVDDYDLYLRLSAAGEFVFLPRVGLYYRRHASNASRNSGRMHANLLALHRKHWGPRPGPGNFIDWFSSRRRFLRYSFQRLLFEAEAAASRGEKLVFREVLGRALRLYPFGIARRSVLRLIFLSLSGLP
jgi:glycosyltransferase involved in cell wall biosynthesis